MMDDHDDGPNASVPAWSALDRVRNAVDGAGGHEQPLAHLTDSELMDGLAELRAGRPARFRPSPEAPEPPPAWVREMTDAQLLDRLRALAPRVLGAPFRSGQSPGPLPPMPALRFVPGSRAPSQRTSEREGSGDHHTGGTMA